MSTHEIAAKLREYQETKALLNEVQDALSALEAEIKAHMGDSEEITAEGIKAKWTRYTTSRFDSKTFKTEHSAMYQQYANAIPAQRFQVTA